MARTAAPIVIMAKPINTLITVTFVFVQTV